MGNSGGMEKVNISKQTHKIRLKGRIKYLGQQPISRKTKRKKVMDEGSWIERKDSMEIQSERNPGHTNVL